MQKSALSRLVIAFWYRLNFEHKSNNIWHTKAIHVLILTPSFTIHPLYRETLQIFLNVSNILFKLTKKKKMNLGAQIMKLLVQIQFSLCFQP